MKLSIEQQQKCIDIIIIIIITGSNVRLTTNEYLSKMQAEHTVYGKPVCHACVQCTVQGWTAA